MDSLCIKQIVCKLLNIFHHGKYLVAYVLKYFSVYVTPGKQSNAEPQISKEISELVLRLRIIGVKAAYSVTMNVFRKNFFSF